MNNNLLNNINLIPNMNNNMNMMPILNNDMNLIPNMNNNMNQINNNMNLIPNMNMNQINNNMNFISNMNINMNQINNDMNIIPQIQQMQQIQAPMPTMNINNKIFDEQENIKKNINNYYTSKLYKIDFTRIEAQNQHFNIIKDKLMNHIRSLEERIEKNNKIMNKYMEEANNIINYNNLLNFSISIEDIYEDKLNELILCVNDITDLYNIRIEELKKNYLNDFNKRYNYHIQDVGSIGFRHTDLMNIKLDQLKFNELCRINFKNITILELRFEDDIDIGVLTKATYHNIYFLGLFGKIKDIKLLSKLPFKLLTQLDLGDNDFYNTNIDIFRNMPFNKLQTLSLEKNKINNISGLSKAPFYELKNLNLSNNLINDIKPLIEFPFKKLEYLFLDNNNIEDIKYIANAPFNNLKTLVLNYNQISNIEVFSQVPFTNLEGLDLGDNKIIDINAFKRISFIYLSHLKLCNNKIQNFEALIFAPFKNHVNIYLDKLQNLKITNQNIYSGITQKFNLILSH